MTKHELGVEAGQVVAGKYRVKSLLGRGGMGSVWRCYHLELMSDVALKVIKPEVAKNQNSVARFMREAKAAAMLRSSHVVQILEHGTEGQIIYIAMELLEGDSLLGRIGSRGVLEPYLVATVMTHVGRAMQKAHDAGIIHRDLKPDNIFLVQNDDEIVAKVLDFGIAKSSVFQLNQTGESPQTQTGALLGTPYYMSPEQATGQKDVDHRADLWAMGVITFECLLGKRPYQSDSLGDLVLQICSRAQPIPSQHGPVPPGFDAWFARAQARDPRQRFQSAKELTGALRGVLLGMSTSHPSMLSSGTDQPRAPMPSTPDRLSVTPTSPAAPLGFPTPREPALLMEDLPTARRSTMPSGPDSAAARSGVGLETLDPLAATTAPKRRRAVVGVAAALIVAGGLATLGVTVLRDDGAGPAAGAASAEPETTSSSAPDMTTTTTTDEAQEVVDLDEPVATTAAVEASAPPPLPIPKARVPAPPPVVVPPPPLVKPPPKPAPDDPLGI